MKNAELVEEDVRGISTQALETPKALPHPFRRKIEYNKIKNSKLLYS